MTIELSKSEVLQLVYLLGIAGGFSDREGNEQTLKMSVKLTEKIMSQLEAPGPGVQEVKVCACGFDRAFTDQNPAKCLNCGGEIR